MALSLKKRLLRIQNTYRGTVEFLRSLDEVLGYFDVDYRPDYALLGFPSGLDESRWKALSYLLYLCRDWSNINKFPREFAAVQSSPVELCGLIESSAHWLTWILSQRLGQSCFEAVIDDPAHLYWKYQEISEADYTNADWWIVSDAVHLKSNDTPGLVNYEVTNRLLALCYQEYERAVDLVKSQSKDSALTLKTQVQFNNFIPSELQRDILINLNRQALTADELEKATSRSRSTLYQHPGGIRELLEKKMILNDRKIGGYYRPDAPPISDSD